MKGMDGLQPHHCNEAQFHSYRTVILLVRDTLSLLKEKLVCQPGITLLVENPSS